MVSTKTCTIKLLISIPLSTAAISAAHDVHHERHSAILAFLPQGAFSISTCSEQTTVFRGSLKLFFIYRKAYCGFCSCTIGEYHSTFLSFWC